MQNKTAKRISMTRQSLVFSIVVILFISMSNGILTYFSQVRTYEAELAENEKAYLDRELDASRSEIQNINSYIDNELDLSEESLRKETKTRVEESHRIALSLYEKNKGEMDEAQLKELIRHVVDSFRHNDETGYNFICQMDGTIILLPPQPELEGSNLMDAKNTDGVYPIRESIEIASSAENEGYIEWHWYRPGEKKDLYKKIGYIMYFEPYDWLIGTGEYLHDAESELKLKVLETIKKIYTGKKQYIFIGKSDGTILMAPYEIDNFYELGTSGNMYIWDIIKGLPEDSKGFVDYVLPENALGYSYSKTSYVLYLARWDWYVGSGINLDFLYSQNLLRREELGNMLARNFFANIALSLITLGIAIYLFAYYNKNLEKEFGVMDDFLSSASGKYKKIDLAKFKYRELFHLASTANGMIDEIKAQRLELEKYSKKMNQLARTDSLTSLLNHRAIMESVQTRMHEAARYHTPLSAIMLDIDDFKLINDTYGHPFGDKVLVRIASIFGENLRETDIIGRYGGEEFLILLPNTDLNDAWMVAEKVRTSIESTSWEIEDLTITVSGGVSEFNGNHDQLLVAEADKKLYKAKSMGKNKMVK